MKERSGLPHTGVRVTLFHSASSAPRGSHAFSACIEQSLTCVFLSLRANDQVAKLPSARAMFVLAAEVLVLNLSLHYELQAPCCAKAI